VLRTTRGAEAATIAGSTESAHRRHMDSRHLRHRARHFAASPCHTASPPRPHGGVGAPVRQL